MNQVIQLKYRPRLRDTGRWDSCGRTIWNNDALRIGNLLVRVDGPIQQEDGICRADAMVHACPNGALNPIFATDIILEWPEV